VEAPAVVGFLALTGAPADRVLACVRALGDAPSLAAGDAPHGIERFDGFTLKWELHGEFLTLLIVRPLAALPVAAFGEPPPTAFDALPPGWLGALPGQTLAAGDVLVVPGDCPATPETLAAWFVGPSTTGAAISGGSGWVYTDFQLHGGRTRWLLVDGDRRGPTAATTVQRLTEIDVYRMTALLGFPVAREAFGRLARIEGELERITVATAALPAEGTGHDEERVLLGQLTGVAAEVESLHAGTAYRFGASQAYWTIVRARLSELDEERLDGLRTPSGFLARRLAPAMESCAAAARRQEQLSARVERASSLLRTRVDVAREEQNQHILAAMERRGKLQLRLQQTVENLSVVAIAYYAVGLFGWMLKPLGLEQRWLELTLAVSVPILVLGTVVAMRRYSRRSAHD